MVSPSQIGSSISCVNDLNAELNQITCQEGVRNSKGVVNQHQLRSPGTAQQPNLMSMPSAAARQYSQTFAQAHQQGLTHQWNHPRS